MISSPAKPAAQRLRGFTFVELMISMSLGSMVLVGVLTTFLMLGRNGIRIANYSAMETQTRRAFDQLGIDARMANAFAANFASGKITSFTLTIPNKDLSALHQVTYGYDTSNSANKKFFVVPGDVPTATAGRIDLITSVNDLVFLRYDADGVLIPASTTSSDEIKHVQVAVAVSRSQAGVAAATQVIRSSAFTLRNISIAL